MQRITLVHHILFNTHANRTDYYDSTREQDMEIVRRVHTLSERYGVKMQQIALAWEWAKGVAAPIIGATKASHFDDAAGAFKRQAHRRRHLLSGRTVCTP